MKFLLNWIDNVEGRLGHWVIRYRWAIILSSLAVVLLAGLGLKDAGLASGYRPLFNSDDPKLAEFDALEAEFTRVNNLVFIIEPPSGDIFTPEVISLVHELTEASWNLPHASRVDSITNFQHVVADGDTLFINDLVDNPPALTPQRLETVRQVALNDPALKGELISKSGHVTAVNVQFDIPPYKLGDLPAEVVATRAADRLLADFEERHPTLNFYLTGRIAVDNAFYQTALDDVEILVPLSLACMLLILFVTSRSLLATAVTSIVIFGANLFALGIIAHLKIPFHTGNAAGPTIILTIASASCVHLMMSYLHYRNRHGDNRGAIVEALRINMQPITLTSITTALGFLSILFSDIPAFRVLSLMVTLGILAALFLALLLLPALLSFMPDKSPEMVAGDRISTPMIDRFGNWIAAHGALLLGVMLCVVVGAAASIPRNQLNDNFIEYFSPSLEFRQHTDFVIEHLSGVFMVQYSLKAGEPGGINTPQFLRETESFTEWLAQQPEVLHVHSIVPTYKRLNKSMHGDDPDFYRIPDSREEAAQYLLLYELSLPYGLDINNQANADKSKTRLITKLRGLSSKEILAFNERAIRWANAHSEHLTVELGTGPTLLFADKSLSNGKDMLITTSLALVSISMLLIVMLRSLRMGLISLIPNLVPAIIGFGIWGLIDGQITITLSLVMTMTLGIVVDDTVHFLSKYQRARRELNQTPAEAVVYSFHTVGQALVVTSLMLAGGFFVLMQSDFLLNSEMGLLTGIIILAALIADFFLLPPLLMMLDRSRDNGRHQNNDQAPAGHGRPPR